MILSILCSEPPESARSGTRSEASERRRLVRGSEAAEGGRAVRSSVRIVCVVCVALVIRAILVIRSKASERLGGRLGPEAGRRLLTEREASGLRLASSEAACRPRVGSEREAGHTEVERE